MIVVVTIKRMTKAIIERIIMIMMKVLERIKMMMKTMIKRIMMIIVRRVLKMIKKTKETNNILTMMSVNITREKKTT